MWDLKVNIKLLNQPCKTAEWLADWLTDWLRHLGTRRAREYSSTQGTCSFEALEHLQGTWAHRQSRHLGTWHSDTWALGHSGTWALEALKALCLADSYQECLERRLWKILHYRELSSNKLFCTLFKCRTWWGKILIASE